MKTLAEVLGGHTLDISLWCCACGWMPRPIEERSREDWRPAREQHATHLATVVSEWLGSDEMREVVAAAMRQFGGRMDYEVDAVLDALRGLARGEG